MKETDKHVLSSAGVDSQRGKLLLMMSLDAVSATRFTEQSDRLEAKMRKWHKPQPPYSSLAHSVERMTVESDVAGSSPAGGAKMGKYGFS